ncbi:tetratricopeptide repeat protein, partial [candidate division GN15 bacterium]|nr:tetratricopeptide repeat protein [candidate division GN15 bacterium]
LAGLGTTFYLFRVQTLLYGDSATILGIVSSPQSDLFFDQLSLQPLSMLLHQSGVQSISDTIGISHQEAFSLISVVGGLTAVGAVWMLSGVLVSRLLDRVTHTLAVFTSGAVILFFGHIENYTWAIAMATWAMYFGVKYSKDGGRWWPAILFAVVAIGFHAVTIPYLFAILLLVVTSKTGLMGLLRPRLLLPVVGITSLAAASAWFLLGRSGMLVAPWPTSYSPYWAFSVSHLVDMLNTILLLAPLSLAWLLFSGSSYATNISETSRRQDDTLAAFAILSLVGAFWIDPEIGAARDFDLLAICAIPLSMWFFISITRRISSRLSSTYVLLWILLLVTMQLTPNLLEKRNANLAAANLDDILWCDPHYSESYNEAQVALSWGFLFTRYGDASDRPLKYFRRRLKAKPNSDAAASHLGDAFREQGKLDSAEVYFRMATGSAPHDAMNWSKLCNILVERDHLREAVQVGRRAVSLDPDLVTAHTTLGIALYRSGLAQEAIREFRTVHQMQPDSVYAAVNLGLCFYGMESWDSCLYYLQRAERLNSHNLGEGAYTATFYSHLALREKAKAASVLDKLRQVGTPPSTINRLSQQLQDDSW